MKNQYVNTNRQRHTHTQFRQQKINQIATVRGTSAKQASSKIKLHTKRYSISRYSRPRPLQKDNTHCKRQHDILTNETGSTSNKKVARVQRHTVRYGMGEQLGQRHGKRHGTATYCTVGTHLSTLDDTPQPERKVLEFFWVRRPLLKQVASKWACGQAGRALSKEIEKAL